MARLKFFCRSLRVYFSHFSKVGARSKKEDQVRYSRLKVLAWLDIFNLRESGGLSKRSTKCESVGLGLSMGVRVRRVRASVGNLSKRSVTTYYKGPRPLPIGSRPTRSSM